jgi:hypothetical protein
VGIREAVNPAKVAARRKNAEESTGSEPVREKNATRPKAIRKRILNCNGLPHGDGEKEFNKFRRDKKEPTPTAGERLPDQSMVALVRDSSNPARAALLHRVEQEVTIAHQIDIGGRRYVPISLDHRLLRRLRLPTRDLPHGPLPELVGQISSILMQTSDLTADYAFVAAVFAVASFFADFALTPLCLSLQGSATPKARRCCAPSVGFAGIRCCWWTRWASTACRSA